MNTALEDELIPGNPCRIKGASTYQHAERPTLGIDEIEELAQTVPDRYKATVYLLAWAGIRLGEAAELRRKDVDLKHSQIRVERAVYPINGQYLVQTPKSRAGARTIVLPAFVTDALREHMRDYSPIGPDGLVFPTRAGKCAYNGIQIAITRTLRAMGYEQRARPRPAALRAAPGRHERRDPDRPPATHGPLDRQRRHGLRPCFARQRTQHRRADERPAGHRGGHHQSAPERVEVADSLTDQFRSDRCRGLHENPSVWLTHREHDRASALGLSLQIGECGFDGVEVPGIAGEEPALIVVDIGEERVPSGDDVDPVSNPHGLGEVTDVFGPKVARGSGTKHLPGVDGLVTPTVDDNVAVCLEYPKTPHQRCVERTCVAKPVEVVQIACKRHSPVAGKLLGDRFLGADDRRWRHSEVIPIVNGQSDGAQDFR